MRRQALNAAFAVLLVLAIADTYRAPLRMRDAPPPAQAYRTLAELPKAPTIELPYWSDSSSFHRHAEYMLASTMHWQPLINGYSDHIPQDFRDAAPVLNTFPSRKAFAILERIGGRYVVVHLDLMDPVTTERVNRGLTFEYADYVRPIETDGNVRLYEIIGWPR